jgi:hypothetical protein
MEYALTGSEDEPPHYDEVVLIQKGRSVVLLYLDPEVGCGGQLCGATPTDRSVGGRTPKVASFVEHALMATDGKPLPGSGD